MPACSSDTSNYPVMMHRRSAKRASVGQVRLQDLPVSYSKLSCLATRIPRESQCCILPEGGHDVGCTSVSCTSIDMIPLSGGRMGDGNLSRIPEDDRVPFELSLGRQRAKEVCQPCRGFAPFSRPMFSPRLVDSSTLWVTTYLRTIKTC